MSYILYVILYVLLLMLFILQTARLYFLNLEYSDLLMRFDRLNREADDLQKQTEIQAKEVVDLRTKK